MLNYSVGEGGVGAGVEVGVGAGVEVGVGGEVGHPTCTVVIVVDMV